MTSFANEKDKLLKLSTGGQITYPEIKLLIHPISIRVVYCCAKLRIHPNILSGLCGLSSILSLVFFHYENYGIALFLCWLRTVFDYADGALARYSKKISKFGAYLDYTFDYLFYFSAIFLILLKIPSIWMRLYLSVSYILYFSLVNYFIVPRIKFLTRRAPVKKYFQDRGLQLGLSLQSVFEPWLLAIFSFGLAPTYLWVPLSLNNLDLIYRLYETFRFYDPKLKAHLKPSAVSAG